MRPLIASFIVLVALICPAPAAASDPFDKTVQWSAVESWNSDKLVYTFEPNGTFKSSDWDNGKGQGSWTLDGNSLIMMWPLYDRAIYRGTMSGGVIRGTAHTRDGSPIGTFEFRLLRIVAVKTR